MDCQTGRKTTRDERDGEVKLKIAALALMPIGLLFAAQVVINGFRDVQNISTPAPPSDGLTRYYMKANAFCAETSSAVESCGLTSGLLVGPGIATVVAGGNTTLQLDSAVVPTFLISSAALAFPTLPAGTCSSDLTFSLLGANPGDAVAPGWPSALASGLSGTMRVSAPDTISVRLCADTTGPVSPASATFTATIVRSF
jgi:hypothetical protein